MLTLVEALHYRCLRYVRRPLSPFQVMVGPNASGKTTFLDVISFLRDLLSSGLDAAVRARTQDFRDLVWRRADSGAFELAVEARIPEDRRQKLALQTYEHVRYQLRFRFEEEQNQFGIDEETVFLIRDEEDLEDRRLQFPQPLEPPETIFRLSSNRKRVREVIHKYPKGNDTFYSEIGRGMMPSFKLGARKSALANLPDDEEKFPVCTWLRELLLDGVQPLTLNSLALREASPPGMGRTFRSDGSNLPWVIHDLEQRRPDLVEQWIEHVRTALPDVEGIRTSEIPDVHKRFLSVRYRGGLEVPSWTASDGTLRMLALTLLAYLPELSGIILIEEPENGIHPKAVETVFQSLGSVSGAQVLLATHSPVILAMADPADVLCFAKDDEGATDIVTGREHPALREWQGDPSLGTLFAAGVLG
jgi:predicted ATPase